MGEGAVHCHVDIVVAQMMAVLKMANKAHLASAEIMYPLVIPHKTITLYRSVVVGVAHRMSIRL